MQEVFGQGTVHLGELLVSQLGLSIRASQSGIYPGPITLTQPADMSQSVPSRKRDEDTGRFQEKYPPNEVIAAIRDIGGRATTAEVAEQIGSSRGSAYEKLRRMEENEQIKSRKTGRVRVWSVAEDSEQQ